MAIKHVHERPAPPDHPLKHCHRQIVIVKGGRDGPAAAASCQPALPAQRQAGGAAAAAAASSMLQAYRQQVTAAREGVEQAAADAAAAFGAVAVAEAADVCAAAATATARAEEPAAQGRDGSLSGQVMPAPDVPPERFDAPTPGPAEGRDIAPSSRDGPISAATPPGDTQLVGSLARLQRRLQALQRAREVREGRPAAPEQPAAQPHPAVPSSSADGPSLGEAGASVQLQVSSSSSKRPRSDDGTAACEGGRHVRPEEQQQQHEQRAAQHRPRQPCSPAPQHGGNGVGAEVGSLLAGGGGPRLGPDPDRGPSVAPLDGHSLVDRQGRGAGHPAGVPPQQQHPDQEEQQQRQGWEREEQLHQMRHLQQLEAQFTRLYNGLVPLPQQQRASKPRRPSSHSPHSPPGPSGSRCGWSGRRICSHAAACDPPSPCRLAAGLREQGADPDCAGCTLGGAPAPQRGSFVPLLISGGPSLHTPGAGSSAAARLIASLALPARRLGADGIRAGAAQGKAVSDTGRGLGPSTWRPHHGALRSQSCGRGPSPVRRRATVFARFGRYAAEAPGGVSGALLPATGYDSRSRSASPRLARRPDQRRGGALGYEAGPRPSPSLWPGLAAAYALPSPSPRPAPAAPVGWVGSSTPPVAAPGLYSVLMAGGVAEARRLQAAMLRPPSLPRAQASWLLPPAAAPPARQQGPEASAAGRPEAPLSATPREAPPGTGSGPALGQQPPQLSGDGQALGDAGAAHAPAAPAGPGRHAGTDPQAVVGGAGDAADQSCGGGSLGRTAPPVQPPPPQQQDGLDGSMAAALSWRQDAVAAAGQPCQQASTAGALAGPPPSASAGSIGGADGARSTHARRSRAGNSVDVGSQDYAGDIAAQAVSQPPASVPPHAAIGSHDGGSSVVARSSQRDSWVHQAGAAEPVAPAPAGPQAARAVLPAVIASPAPAAGAAAAATPQAASDALRSSDGSGSGAPSVISADGVSSPPPPLPSGVAPAEAARPQPQHDPQAGGGSVAAAVVGPHGHALAKQNKALMGVLERAAAGSNALQGRLYELELEVLELRAQLEVRPGRGAWIQAQAHAVFACACSVACACIGMLPAALGASAATAAARQCLPRHLPCRPDHMYSVV